MIQGMLVPAICSFSTPSLLVLISMLVWLTVLAAYWNLGKPANCQATLTSHSHLQHLVEYPKPFNECREYRKERGRLSSLIELTFALESRKPY